MTLPLSLLPISILANILDRIPTLDVYEIVFLTGDRLLEHKARHGGVTNLFMGRISLGKIGLEFTNSFKGLYHITIDATYAATPPDLSHLPSTLRSLRINGLCPMWLDVPADPRFLSHPENLAFHFCGRSVFAFHHHLPVLEHLELHCLHRLRHTEVHCRGPSLRTQLLVSKLLPSTLRSLSMTHMTDVFPSIGIEHLSPGLVVELSQNTKDRDWLQQMASHPANFQVSHFRWLDSNADAALSVINPQMVYIDMRHSTSVISSIKSAYRLFPASSAPSSSGAFSREISGQIVSIRTTNLFYRIRELSEKGELDFRWPPTLRIIDDTSTLWSYSQVLSNGMPMLPTTLTDLSISVSTFSPTNSFAHLPLRRLDVTFFRFSEFHKEFGPFLPQCLSELILRHTTGAQGLTTLVPLSAAFFHSLPSNLSFMFYHGYVIDTELVNIPTRLANGFSAYCMILTGALVTEGTTKLYVPKASPLNRINRNWRLENSLDASSTSLDSTATFTSINALPPLNSTRSTNAYTPPNSKLVTPTLRGDEEFDFKIMSENDGKPLTLNHRWLHLPSSLTHLVLRSASATWISVAPEPLKSSLSLSSPIVLPHLKTLELDDFVAFKELNFADPMMPPSSASTHSPSSLYPSLTHLILHCAERPQKSQFDMPMPPSLTCLTFKSTRTQESDCSRYIPRTLRPQLVYLDCSDNFLEIDSLVELKCMTSLRTLRMRLPNFTNSGSEHLPPTLTHLALTTACADSYTGLVDLVSELPQLRILEASDWTLSVPDLEHFSSRLERLCCSNFAIGPPSDYLYDISAVDDSMDLTSFLACKLQEAFPVLHYQDGPQKVTISCSHPIFSPPSRRPDFGNCLLRLTIGDGFVLNPRFGSLLPRTLTYLDVMHAKGVNSATLRRLPASLKELMINTSHVSAESYIFPSGLQVLKTRSKKWICTYNKRLPCQLLHLTIETELLRSENALLYLPETLTSLEMLNCPVSPKIDAHLLPSLLTFTYNRNNSNAFTLNLLHLPPTLTTLNIVGEAAETNCPRDVLLRYLWDEATCKKVVEAVKIDS